MSRMSYQILIVEDSIEDQEIFKSYLCASEDCDYNFWTANTGRVAVDLCENRVFDCILLDYHLPDMDGIKVLEKMIATNPADLPVVMITGQGDEKLAVKALRLGAADYFVKSTLTPENLVRAVQNAIHRHRTSVRLKEERERFEQEQRAKIEAQNREIEALQEIKRQQDRLQNFFQQVPTPVAVLKGHKGIFEFLNQPMKDLITFSGHEHRVLATTEDCFGPELADIVRMVYKSGRSFKANEFEIERNWKSGDPELRYFQLAIDPLREDDDQVTGSIMMLTDITTSVQARHLVEESEVRAKESEDRFRQIAEIVPYMIWVMGPSGEGEYFNSSFLNYTGTSLQENQGFGWLDWIHPSDQEAVRALWEDSFTEQKVFEATYRIKRARDGSFRWHLTRATPLFMEGGGVQKWYGSSSDINDQRTLTESLRDSEKRLRVATESSMVGVWEIDIETRKTWRNIEHDKLFGYETKQNPWTVGILLDHVIEEDRDRVAKLFHLGLDELRPFEVEFQVLWPNNTLHWLHIRSSVDRATTGRLRLAGTVIEVTDRKLKEQELKDAKNIAVAANETKTIFLANMSHEIRTPLNAIMGFTDLIASESITQEERSKFAQTVQRNGEALMQIIDDILDLSKIEAGRLEVKKERTVLSSILQDLRMLYSGSAKEKSLELNIIQDEAVPDSFLTDSIRLKQVLTNALGNAIKFTSSGSVTVTVKFSITAGTSTRWIIFSICDTGIGISETQQAKLFQPFVQADGHMNRKYGGTGLGLMLSRRLAKLLDGSFYLVRSRVDEGSVFELRIPYTPVEEGTVPSPSLTLPSSSTKSLEGLEVLLIDDSADSRYLAKIYLERAGAEVTEASDAKTGLKILDHKEFAVIISDVQMPEMDGHEFSRTLRAKGNLTPIIGLTAHVMLEDKARSLEAGMNAHVGKPIRRDELMEAVSRVTTSQLYS